MMFLDLNPALPTPIRFDRSHLILVTARNANTPVVDVTPTCGPPSGIGRRLFVYGYVPTSLVKNASSGKDGQLHAGQSMPRAISSRCRRPALRRTSPESLFCRTGGGIVNKRSRSNGRALHSA